jgi:hypothetical protein
MRHRGCLDRLTSIPDARNPIRTTGITDDGRRNHDELDIWPDTFHRVPVSPPV